MDFLLIQFIGAIGYSMLAASYFKKEKKQILFMQIISYIMFALHYYFLNGITGTICNLIGLFALITIFLFEKYNLKLKNLIAFIFVTILLVVNIIAFQNFYSIFPLIASIIVIISFLLNDEENIRGIGVVSALCWLVYAIVYKSYISIAFEAVTLIGVCIAFIKNTKKHK